MSHYDDFCAERFRLNVKRLCFLLPTAALAGCAGLSVGFWQGILAALVGSLATHFAFYFSLLSYRTLCCRASQLATDIATCTSTAERTIAEVSPRKKGERFKTAYGLSGRSVSEFEHAMAVGMLHEVKEVYVTAFIKGDTVLRVTASVGSAFKCSAADDPNRWASHFDRLGCTEIRQYHNHPTRSNRTGPSRIDVVSAASLEGVGRPIRHFIVYWNVLREWRMLEYTGAGKHWSLAEYDSFLNRVVALPTASDRA